MYCVYCNHPLKGDEKECPSCGRPCGTFVQIEAFRNGKGQKAAASSLSELTFSERQEDFPAKIAAMSKEIKALKQENEELKKEQINLRELMVRQTPTSEGGSFTPTLITAAVAALIPLLALVVVCVAFGKKTANMDNTVAVISERIDTVLGDIEELKKSEKDVEELKSTVNTLDEELKSTAKTLDEELKPAMKTLDEELKPIVEKLEKDIEDIKAVISGEKAELPVEEEKEASEENDPEAAPEPEGDASADPDGETPADAGTEAPDEAAEPKTDVQTAAQPTGI